MGLLCRIFDEVRWAVFRQKTELWSTVYYMKLCVDRDLKTGRYLVLPSWQYLQSQSALCHAVYGEKYKSNLSLYCTPHYSADSDTVALFLYNSVATTITTVHFFHPSTAVQFI